MACAGGQAPVGTATAAGVPGTRYPDAWRVHRSPTRSGSNAYTPSSRRPESSGEPTRTWTTTAPRSGSSRGAEMVSSSTRSQPTSSPARRASSTNPVPGNSTRPPTVWSASQGCVRDDHRPVSTVPSPSASSTAAPSSGWRTAPRPAPVTSPDAAPAASGQYRSCWNA